MAHSTVANEGVVEKSSSGIAVPAEIVPKRAPKLKLCATEKSPHYELQVPRPLSSQAPPRSLRKYITTGKKVKIRAMASAGMSRKTICEVERISADQFDMIMEDPSLDILDSKIVEETKKTLGAGFLQLSDLALQQAGSPEKLEKMNAFQSTIIAATAYDKFRLSENLSTQNISIQGIVAHLHNEKEELRKAREALIESLQ